jgi:hypothetical protein
MPVNRTLDVLTATDATDAGWRTAMAEAGVKLGDWTIAFTGLEVDGPYLTALAAEAPGEPFVRVVRERMGRAVDVPDFVLFLDDVLALGEAGHRGEIVHVPAGRARSAGVLIHPDDVFKKGKPRRWGRRAKLSIDVPIPQERLEPAADGDLLGPNWTTRFENPSTEEESLSALRAKRPEYATRVTSLTEQLRAAGAEVYLTSTVRKRERGYLMWGAFVLSRAKDEAAVTGLLAKLAKTNADWKLNVDIVWEHPDGWEATQQAARAMADSYDVVYATENGARWSKHYSGVAADFVAIALPRELTLEAPDGVTRTFDLSDPDQTRDLSLSPEIITWTEAHFGMGKLRSDYPHWNDTK